MEVTYASVAAPGSPESQDFVVCGPQVVVIVDGATPEPGVPSGCVHGVAWFARMLGLAVIKALVPSPPSAPTLNDALQLAIQEVRSQHAGTCDLANRYSPSATLAILRCASGDVDYLVLGDCAVILHTNDGRTNVAHDDRLGRLRLADGAARSRLRNTDNGFWVAGTTPEAADHAIAGVVDAAELHSVALLTDGACRLVSDFDREWPEVIEILDAGGPRRLIGETRSAESASVENVPAHKRYDDATAVLCRFAPEDRCR